MQLQDIGHADLLCGGGKEDGRLVIKRDDAVLSLPVGIPGLDHIVIRQESFRTQETAIKEPFNCDWLSFMTKVRYELGSHGYKVEIENDEAIRIALSGRSWSAYLGDFVLQFLVGIAVFGVAIFLRWYFS